MDKRVILAVAGSGKTSHIINCLSTEKRSLIITYTENNYNHLRKKIIQKFGNIPPNITVQTYFTFLYSFCYKPFLSDKYNAKGINWKTPPAFTLKLKRSDKRFYVDKSNRLYSNRIAKLIEQESVIEYIRERLCKYYDNFFVDEVQDFGGHDFNFLKQLCTLNLNICLVGDFYQHTFDTSNDGNVNKSLYKDFEKYKKNFEQAGLKIDITTLAKSYRCTPQVCNFITSELGINIQSQKEDSSTINFVDDQNEIEELLACDKKVKLFYQNHKKYDCYSQNWGNSKGQDHYVDICIVLNKTTMQAYKNENLDNLKPVTKNKFYVACTRAHNNIFFIEEAKLRQYKIT